MRSLIINFDDEIFFDVVAFKNKRQKRRKIDNKFVDENIVALISNKQRRIVREKSNLNKITYNMFFHFIDDILKSRIFKKKNQKKSIIVKTHEKNNRINEQNAKHHTFVHKKNSKFDKLTK